MLERFKKLLEEKGILNKLTGDKIADVIILTRELIMDNDFSELIVNIGLTEAVNYITVNSKEKSIETSVENLIEKYEGEINEDYDVILTENEEFIPKGAKGKDLQPNENFPFVAWDKPYTGTYEQDGYENVWAVRRVNLKKIK